MHTNPAVKQNKTVKWFDSRWNQSGRWGKGLWWKGFAKEPWLDNIKKAVRSDEEVHYRSGAFRDVSAKTKMVDFWQVVGLSGSRYKGQRAQPNWTNLLAMTVLISFIEKAGGEQQVSIFTT